MTKLNKVVVVLDEKKIKEITEGKVDKRTLNPGRPVNKKSARYIRLKKQALYAKLNKSFVSGKSFKLKENQSSEYHYTPNASTDGGALFNGIGHYVCNIDYIGRTKATGFTFVLDKKVNVEINLKQVKFVS